MNDVRTCNHYQIKREHHGIDFRIAQIAHCSSEDILQVISKGLLPDYVDYSSSIAGCDGIWNCVLLKSELIELIVYSGGHNTPLYMFKTICK